MPLTLAARLALTLSLLVLMVVAMAGLALHDLTINHQASEALARHALGLAAQAQAAEADVARLHRTMKDVALASTPQELRQATAQAQDEAARIDQRLQSLRSGFAGPAALLDAVQTGLLRWSAVRTRVIELTQGGQTLAAATLTRTEGAGAVAAVVHSVDALNQWGAAQSRKLLANAEEDDQRSRATLAAMSAVSALAGALLGVLLMRHVQRTLGADPAVVRHVVQALASGDLRPTPTGLPPPRSLLAAVVQTRAQLAAVVQAVRHKADDVTTASHAIARASANQQEQAMAQSLTLQAVREGLGQLAQRIEHNAHHAAQANDQAQQARQTALAGGEMVAHVTATMGDIRRGAARIQDIVGVIDGLAIQTKLLAMNAAVESARAAGAGHGFAAVAKEVQALAQQSAQAAQAIRHLLDTSAVQVQAGTELIDRSSQGMQQIVATIGTVTDAMAQISEAGQQQQRAVRQLSQSVHGLGNATAVTLDTVTGSARAAQALRRRADELMASVATFKLGDNGDHTSPDA